MKDPQSCPVLDNFPIVDTKSKPWFLHDFIPKSKSGTCRFGSLTGSMEFFWPVRHGHMDVWEYANEDDDRPTRIRRWFYVARHPELDGEVMVLDPEVCELSFKSVRPEEEK